MDLIAVDLAALSDARRLAHHLVQPLAGIATAVVEPQSDDSHTTLRWDDSGALVTQPARSGAVYGVDLSRLEVVAWRDVEEREPIQGWRLGRVWDWFRERVDEDIQHRDYGEPMPPHPVADVGAPLPWPSGAMHSFSDVMKLGFELLRPVAESSGGWSEVRNWPHHFDIATICVLDLAADREHARSINVGLSPGDGSHDEPYFYVTPWPAPDVSSAPALPGAGRWTSEGFTAAMITVAQHDLETLASFITTAVAAAHDMLT